VAPVIHDFTYEPLVYDLLPMEGNVFKYEATTNAGEGTATAPGAPALLVLWARPCARSHSPPMPTCSDADVC
jgi:hypothetical protein